ncbi:MAG: MATE family efflux transporter [Gemmatales bacterium]|nr:MATE family efflux transporter [Gemmatales bacterium]MDW7994873.1 MATE family efflux transporter [Gemmatales bacterium]
MEISSPDARLLMTPPRSDVERIRTNLPTELPDLSLDGQPTAVLESPPNPVLQRSLWRWALALALPVMVQQFLALAVSLSDRFIAGRFLGMSEAQMLRYAERYAQVLAWQTLPTGLGGTCVAANLVRQAEWERHRVVAYQSAQTTAGYLSWFVSSFTVLVTVGATALVARHVGAGEYESALRAMHQALNLAALFGLAGTILGYVGVEALVWALQMRGLAAEYTAAYLRPIFLALSFQMIEAVGLACLAGAGDTVTGMWVLSGVALVNLPLSWAFCLGWGPFPELGFVGIAVGTACSHVLGCIAVLCVLARGRAGLRLQWHMFRPQRALMLRMLRVSVPAGVDSLSVVLWQLWFLSIVNGLGLVASAAHGIAIQWEALGYLSGGAFAAAAMTMVGQSLGAGSPQRARQAGWTAFALGGAVMCVMGAIFYMLAEPMFRLFCPYPEQEPIVRAGVPVLRLIAYAMPVLASCIIFTGALRGAGDTRVPVLFTWIGFLGVRIPLAYWFTGPSWQLGLLGAWYAMVIDLVVRGLAFLIRFARGRWHACRV